MLRSEEKLKKQIKELYETNPVIHVDVALSRPKFLIKNAEVRIKGVYPHIFQVEENANGLVKCHTIQYTDLLIGSIVIAEIEKE